MEEIEVQGCCISDNLEGEKMAIRGTCSIHTLHYLRQFAAADQRMRR